MNNHLALALALPLALLAGCGGPGAEPPTPAGHAATSSAPARPSGPITRYDGTYAGTLTPTSGAYSCPNAVRGTRSMTVHYGRALVDMNPGRGSPMQGMVQENGALRATDQIDRTIAVNGQIVNEQFVGAWTQGRCAYNLNFRRTG